MASGIINIVEFTKLQYAAIVDFSSASLPSLVKEITADELKDGTFNLDIPSESLTSDFTEDGGTYNVRTTPSLKKASIGLVTATAATIADFAPADLAMGALGGAASTLKFGATAAPVVPNMYIKISGKNSDGKLIVVELFNAKVTHSWSGNNGKSQEPAPFTVTFSVLKNRGYGSTYQISPIF